MAKMTFVIGGARSGKSAFAEELAKKYNDVVYIATAEVKDEEMRERIQIHRNRRPFNWKTIESPLHIDSIISALNEKISVVYIDCITLYITNMLLNDETGVCEEERPLTPKKPSDSAGSEWAILKQKQSYILMEINKLSKVCRESKSDVIMVSNEVGLGIVPDNALSRVFVDIAGRANQVLAEEADEVYFMVAGISQRIK